MLYTSLQLFHNGKDILIAYDKRNALFKRGAAVSAADAAVVRRDQYQPIFGVIGISRLDRFNDVGARGFRIAESAHVFRVGRGKAGAVSLMVGKFQR